MGEKITAQTENTSPAFEDVLLSVDDPGGTPLDRKVTVQSIVNTAEKNAQVGTTYTLVLGDRAKIITMNNASANTLTIPTNASVAFPIGTCIVIQQLGAGVTTIDGDTGVTVQGGGASVSGGGAAISNRYSLATIIKMDTDTWVLQGDVGTIA